MRTCLLLLGIASLAGCNVSIPNGLFACGQPSDCPTGFFCWNSDSRCYDAKEPGCQPKACDTIIAEFAVRPSRLIMNVSILSLISLGFTVVLSASSDSL